MKRICLLILLLSTLIYAQDIYIGDKINLKIKNSSEKEIREALTEWEIKKMTSFDDGNIVTFTGYNPENKKIILKKKEIIIPIKTSLTSEEVAKEDLEIFMDLTDKSNKILENTSFPYFSIISSIGIILSSIFLLKEFFKSRKKNFTPAEKFKIGLSALDKDRWNFEISILLREYIDNIYFLNFRKGIYETYKEIDTEDIDFLKDLDTLKFSEGKAGGEKAKGMEYSIKRAFDIFNKINLREEKKDV